MAESSEEKNGATAKVGKIPPNNFAINLFTEPPTPKEELPPKPQPPPKQDPPPKQHAFYCNAILKSRVSAIPVRSFIKLLTFR